MRSKRRGLVSSLLLVIGLAAVAPATALGTPAYLVDTLIGGQCVSGSGTPSTDLTVTVRNPSGTTVFDDSDVHVDAFGAWNACGANLILVPGMAITLSGPAHRSVTVPFLIIHTDRVTNVLSGRGPAGETIPLGVSRCDPLGCDSKNYVADVNGQGTYSLDLDTTVTKWNLVGGDEISSEVYAVAGDHFAAHAEAPYLEMVNRSVANVYMAYRSTVKVDLRTKNGVLRATRTRTATVEGPYRFEFRHNGALVKVNPTDKIVADFATDAAMVWPQLDFSAQAGTDNVTGHCLPNAIVQAHPENDNAYLDTSAADGAFNVAVGPSMTNGEHVAIACYRKNGDLLRGATVAN